MMLGSNASDIDKFAKYSSPFLLPSRSAIVPSVKLLRPTPTSTMLQFQEVSTTHGWGVVDYVMRCATCHNDNRTPWQDIELAAPMFNAIYVDMVRNC
jgi:hypothetical protein